MQKGVDVGLEFHPVRSFVKVHWDRVYLVAGDGDFHEIIHHLVKNEGVHVTDAVSIAIWQRGKPDALLHHSVQGSQYTGEQF